MAPLKAAFLALVLLWPGHAMADPIDRWSAEIGEASSRFGIPVAWIRRVMRAESAGRTRLGGRPIVSSAGAMGLMQLMPGTWAEMRRTLGLGPDPHDPRDNILAGTAYLRMMYDRFGYPGLFAAYNAGPARYSQYLRRGRGLPSETIAYVAQVAGGAPASRSPAGPTGLAAAPAERPTLFAIRGEASPAVRGTAPPQPAAPSLFFMLRGPASP